MVNNLAVDAALRRRGVGRLLLRHSIEHGAAEGCRVAFLDVRASNEAALRLYASHGFQVTGRRRKYYSDTGEDALVMRAILDNLASG